MTPDPTAAELQTRLEACINRLDDAIAAARADQVISIADMEFEVERLSRAIMNAPIATGHEVQSQVAAMIARFDMLEGELRALQDRTGQPTPK